MMQTIYVRHNAEIAHRLSQLPGKCQQIHGHSIQIKLSLGGNVNSQGILLGLDFGTVKSAFRSYIDETFDHHLLLNEFDPLLTKFSADAYPGVRFFPGDPTIENLAKWIREWGVTQYNTSCITVEVQETNTNGATADY